ncbi:MAG: transposase [Deltaproteobacteria bacterium]|nr:transposase [Deltaproteobacteria bacterium]
MRTRYKISDSHDDALYFTTSSTVEWIPVFTCNDHFEIIMRSLNFYRKEKRMKLYAYVIMENHLHLIVAAGQLSEVMKSFKSYTSRELIESMKMQNRTWMLNQFAYFKKRYKTESSYQIWQEGFHPQMISDEKMLLPKIEYIHANPVRRGYVERPEYWKYSSAGYFVTHKAGMVEIDELRF